MSKTMKKSIATAALLLCAAAACAAPDEKSVVVKQTVLEKDTEVLVTVLDRLTPRTVKSGDIVLFSVAYPVKNKDRQVVIEQSADAWGTIVRVPKTKALSTDEPDWEKRPEWDRPDRPGQLEKERERREKLRKKLESRVFKKQKRGKKITSDDVYPPTEDKNWGTLGITIDRATMVTGKDVALIADVAREDSHTMITLDRKASFDVPQLEREQAERAAMKAQGTPVSDDKTISRDITLAIPWNVFTTGTLSVVEPGTVLRARVLADVVISEDVRPKEEIRKPVPKPKKPKKPVARRPKKRKARKRPGRKCPCCFICHCEERTGRPCGAWKNQPCPPPAAPAPAAPTPAPAPAPAPEAPAPAPETAQKS
jgi:hypothetical protein